MNRKFSLTDYVMDITVWSMNASADSPFLISATAALAEKENRASRKEMDRELTAMSAAMIEEKGLLNHTQAALLLDVSVKRVGELVRLGKLTRFDFLGRTYVSVREVRARCQQDLKAGRPKRGIVQRAVASVRAALKTDAAQAKLGGYAGPYEKQKGKKKS
jgi:hypothetical protein